VSNLEWDVYMAILRDKSDDPSVWARNKLQQIADRIHALTAERDEAESVQNALKAALEEARLEVCECRSQLKGRDFTPMQIAEQRGWPDALAALEEAARESYKGGD
jgi:hypothetical protein